jgi:dienelactone hydrolase
MSVVDCLLLGAILLACGWWIAAPRTGRSWLRLAPLALLALAVLQFALEGFTWQAIPAWLVIAVLGLLSVRRMAATPGRGLGDLTGKAGLLVLALAMLGPWMLILPAPVLPTPAITLGTRIYRWTDASRDEPATADTGDRRSVIAQVFYPAAEGARGPHSVYIDGLRALPAKVSIMPGFMLATFGRIDTHAVVDAPISPARKWPIVLFSPGYGGPRATYTGLAEGLAAKGYVVVTLDHPYESAVTELPDGRIVSTIDNFPANASEGEGDAWMAGQLDVRAADMLFALNQLRPEIIGDDLAAHLDLGHVAAIGHSLGGATAVVAMQADARIEAAANVDGTPYGAMTTRPLDRPFLLLQSDYGESGHSDKFIQRNRAIIQQDAAPAWHYEIHRANHYSFTDAPLFLALPARFALSLLIGGGRGPEEPQRASADILAAFLQGPLGGAPGDIEAAAASYKDISGGPEH